MKYTRLHILAVLVAIVFTHDRCAHAAAFAFEKKADEFVITCGGRAIATYVWRDEKILRPYFKNVCTLDGLQVTRNHPPIAGKDAVDHADMHPGIWLAFGAINDQDFWRNQAK